MRVEKVLLEKVRFLSSILQARWSFSNWLGCAIHKKGKSAEGWPVSSRAVSLRYAERRGLAHRFRKLLPACYPSSLHSSFSFFFSLVFVWVWLVSRHNDGRNWFFSVSLFHFGNRILLCLKTLFSKSANRLAKFDAVYMPASTSAVPSVSEFNNSRNLVNLGDGHGKDKAELLARCRMSWTHDTVNTRSWTNREGISKHGNTLKYPLRHCKVFFQLLQIIFSGLNTSANEHLSYNQLQLQSKAPS